MSAENRDFVIERLEKKLAEKDEEIETMGSTLRDSIMRELRNDLKNDLDINNRLNKIEQDVKELSSNISGMLDELLDQKSQLRSLVDTSSKTGVKVAKATNDVASSAAAQVPVGSTPDSISRLTDSLFGKRSHSSPNETSPSPNVQAAESKPTAPREWPGESKAATSGAWPGEARPTASQSPPSSNSQNTSNSPSSPTPPSSSWGNLADSGGVNMNIREVESEEPPQRKVESVPSEYIVASDVGFSTGPAITPRPKSDDCEYIVAEEGESLRRRSETEFETVEDRDDEDTVITTTRKKSL